MKNWMNWRKPSAPLPLPSIDFNDAMSVARALQPLARRHTDATVMVKGSGGVVVSISLANYTELRGRGDTLKEACDDMMMQSAMVSAVLSDLS